MKLIKKICCLSVLFGSCMFFVMKNVNASDDVVPLVETSADGDYDSFIKETQDELEKNGTSVENELSKMRDEYISKLDDIDDEKIKQSANEIINTLNECMISKTSIENFGYKGVMLAMIAFFNVADWKLSAELLTHMMNNEVTDSLYYSVNTDVLIKSNRLLELSKDISVVSGKDNFDDNSDLNYSIHGFQYNKEYYSDDTIIFHLRDRYDFDYINDDGYGSLAKKGNNLLVKYQNEGLIKPYIVDMETFAPGKVSVIYDFTDDIAQIKGVPEYTYDNISIPEQILDINTYVDISGAKTKDVKAIKSHSFTECQNLTSITIPSFINMIGNDAFSECQNLKEIVIEGNNVQIGKNAFQECINLTKIVINGSNVNKADSAFNNCTILTNIIVPNELVTYYRHNSTWTKYREFINNADKSYVYISPNKMNFEQEYCKEETEGSFTTYERLISTKRLRTGCIYNQYSNDQYIVLSARKADAGIAYLELDFSNYIKEICFNISLWGKNEYLSSSDTCVLQYEENGEWHDYFDIMEKIYAGENYFCSLKFKKNVSKIRIYLKTDPVGTKNKGRVKIDGFSVVYKFVEEYKKYDRKMHMHYYSDGSYVLEPHTVNNTTNRIVYCVLCGQELDKNTDGPFITISEFYSIKIKLKEEEYA